MTPQEALAKYALNRSLSGADLREENLYGANLEGANLEGANLSGASLSDANLRNADLRNADLAGADLLGTDLEGANLKGADLSDVRLNGARLRGADLTNVVLRGADLYDANLIGACLLDAEWDRTTVWPKGFTPPPPKGTAMPKKTETKVTTTKKWEVHIEGYHREDGFDSLVYYSDAKTTNAAITEAEILANADGYVVNQRLTEVIDVTGEVAARKAERDAPPAKPKLSFDSRLILIKSLVEASDEELRARERDLVSKLEELAEETRSIEYALKGTRMLFTELRAACAAATEET
jgi:hypothetical protein